MTESESEPATSEPESIGSEYPPALWDLQLAEEGVPDNPEEEPDPATDEPILINDYAAAEAVEAAEAADV